MFIYTSHIKKSALHCLKVLQLQFVVPYSVFFKNTSGHHAMAFFFVHCLSNKMKGMQCAKKVILALQRAQ